MAEETTQTAETQSTETQSTEAQTQTQTQQTATQTDGGAEGGAITAQPKTDEGDKGALGSESAEPETLDFEKMTDDEYASKLEKIDGLNSKLFAKTYGKFCRDKKLDPSVVSEYLKMEKGLVDGRMAEAKAKKEADVKAFQEEGVALRKEYNPQQINSAIQGLKSLGADEKFMKFATHELSNNKTLVKLLMNWNETHGEDGVPGSGGTASETDKTFEQVWTGKK